MRAKDYYDGNYAKMLAEKIGGRYPLDREAFVSEIAGAVEGKEYTQRLAAIVEVFDRHLPGYAETLRLFEAMLGPELPSFAEMYSAGRWLAPIGKYVEAHGAAHAEDFEQTVHFIAELTKRYTGEFAMRPLIEAFPERSMAVLRAWSRSESPYVRRLSSECMRVRLPWARKLTAAVERFEDYAGILGNLRQDENPYVRRSVANNLNDLYKYDAAKAQQIVDAWSADSPSRETQWIIRYGSRSQRKKARSS